MIAAKLREFRSAPNFADYLLIAAIVIAMSAVTVWWVNEDTRPPNWDEGGHLFRSLFYREHLLNLDIVTFLVTYAVYPPLVFWITQPFYLVFGTGMTAAVASQSVFMAVLAFSMYELGRELWSRRVGLLAMVFVLTLPMVISTFHEYQLDAPKTAMTALALLCLVRCREFTDRNYSVALGVALGLGLLTKWTFFFVMLLPVAWALYQAVRDARSAGDWKRLRLFGIVIGLTLVIAAPWYLGHVTEWIAHMRYNAEVYGIREGDPEVTSLDSVVWYFSVLVNQQLYLVPAILTAVGVAFLFRGENARRNMYPLLLILGTYVFFTLLRNKDPRYLMPLVTAVGIIAVYWVDQLRGVTWPRISAAVIVAYAAIGFVAVSFGLGFLKDEQRLNLAGTNLVVYAERGYRIGPPSSDPWMLEDIVKQISATKSGEERAIYDHGSGGDSVWFNNASFSYYGEIHGVDFIDRTRVNDAEFIVKHNRDPRHEPPAGFKAVDSWTLPNGTLVTLMQRTSPAAPGSPGASAR